MAVHQASAPTATLAMAMIIENMAIGDNAVHDQWARRNGPGIHSDRGLDH